MRNEQQHCCWESLRDNSLVNLKVQPSQTELLFRSVDDSFLPCGRLGQQWYCCILDGFLLWELWELWEGMGVMGEMGEMGEMGNGNEL